jgi:hypothetical protein
MADSVSAVPPNDMLIDAADDARDCDRGCRQRGNESETSGDAGATPAIFFAEVKRVPPLVFVNFF